MNRTNRLVVVTWSAAVVALLALASPGDIGVAADLLAGQVEASSSVNDAGSALDASGTTAAGSGSAAAGPTVASTYLVVDTGQDSCYDTSIPIPCPAEGMPFCGQDAQNAGHQPGFILSEDGLTVHDTTTGLTWQQMPDSNLDGDLEPDDKLSWWDALDQPAALNAITFGGYSDWRLPSIKELYSLIDFRGVDPSGYVGNPSGLVPFIDTDYFAFIYGDESIGERIIDSQYWSSTEYVSTTMNGDHTVFGVNFADGRIKGYGTTIAGNDKLNFVLCVRGNPDYGANDFVDNGDGTVTDLATGLMWMQDDSGEALNWEDALAYADWLTFAGHDEWRLPNAKELQSIVDYTRSPDTDGTAAIDPIFNCSAIIDEGGGTNFPFYWTSTTHANWTVTSGAMAVYVAFGEALGWMQSPFPPFNYTLLDVHGAGAQRSDPKEGDPANWPHGHGPQGDVIRIYNHVRCVRDAAPTSGTGDQPPDERTELYLENLPNPFNPVTDIAYHVPAAATVTLAVFDSQGWLVRTLVQESVTAGDHIARWDGRDSGGRDVASGIYLARLSCSAGKSTVKMVMAR